MKRALKITAICATLLVGTAFVVWIRPFAWWVFNYAAAWNGGAWVLCAAVMFGLGYCAYRLVRALTREIGVMP